MAANVKVTLLVEIDGEPVRGYPLVRRFTVDELFPFNYEKTSGAGFADIPDSQLATGQLLLIQPDQQTDYQFSDGAGGAAAVTLNASGLILVLNGSWANGVEVENTSGNTAVLKGVVGGT